MTVVLLQLFNIAVGLALAPFLLGLINRTKALFAGRDGQPLFQAYFDIWRLLHKGAVYSKTTTWIFRAGPIVGLAATLIGLALVPFGSVPALVAFQGDFILLVYLLALMRLFVVLAALDTGSAFEGMGASREVYFSIFAEIAMILGIAAIAKSSANLSLSAMFSGVSFSRWSETSAVLVLVSMALFVVFLTENARIPVDDPNTHLELTMIHEVMVLDHSGPDFAMILYSGSLKLWILGALVIQTVLPIETGSLIRDELVFVSGMFALAILVGAIESVMARLRLLNVPRFLVGAGAFSVLALFLVLR